MDIDIKLSDEAARAIAAAAATQRVSTGQYLARFVQAWAKRMSDEPLDPDQAWFWTPEWQAGELAAEADLAAGRSTRFASDEDFLRALEARLDDPTEASANADS